MKLIRALAAAAAVATLPLAAPVAFAQDVTVPSGAYKLDPTHASITWKVSHMGLSSYTARFTQFDIQLNLDTENPTASTVSATIDPTSVRTDFPGQKDFDGEISGSDKLLNAGSHPQITFASKSVTMTGDNTAEIVGDLTMLGVTQEVTLSAVLNGALPEHPFAKVPAVGFSATGTLDRTAFGMDFLAPQVVGPEVQVAIEAEFLKAN
ncbi:MAG: YceI family protein [Pseudomonadota bacterium]